MEWYIPTAGKKDLTIDFDGRFAAELSANKVGIVRGVDVVMAKWLVHILVNVQPIEEHRGIVI